MLTGSPNLNIENIDFSNQMRYEGAWITLSTARGGSFKEIKL
jgi:hypothetical protein